MSLMNIKFSLLIYEDPSHESPKIRTPDITRDYQKVTVTRPASDEFYLGAGESAMLATTARTVGLDNTTELQLVRPFVNDDRIRLLWTGVGTNPAFRTKRTIGIDATTTVSVTRQAPNTVRIASVSGTAINSAAVLVGDFVKLEGSTDTFTSVWNDANQNIFWQVQSKGTGYIDILDNGAFVLEAGIVLGADFDKQLRVISAGNVKVGDTVELIGGINIGNKGKFQIINLSSDYVEFVNPFAIAETFTVNSNVSIYDRLIGIVLIRSTGEFRLLTNGQSEGVKVAMFQSEALYLSSTEAHALQAVNEGTQPITIRIQHASVIG